MADDINSDEVFASNEAWQKEFWEENHLLRLEFYAGLSKLLREHGYDVKSDVLRDFRLILDVQEGSDLTDDEKPSGWPPP